MEVATIKFSDLGDRWDAKFHMIKKRLGPRAEELAQDPAKTPEALAKAILSLPPSVWQYLMPLSRTNVDRMDRNAALRVVQEYPHLALALIEEHRHEIEGAAKLKIAKANEEIEILDQMIADLGHSRERLKG